MRVLVVEDEAALAEQIARTLQDRGYVVDLASDGREAWYQGGVQDYDAILLDLGLPVLDGLSVLRRWRSEGMRSPVLVLTARDQWHEKVAGIDAGADDYLTKPFDKRELIARIQAMAPDDAGYDKAVMQLTAVMVVILVIGLTAWSGWRLVGDAVASVGIGAVSQAIETLEPTA